MGRRIKTLIESPCTQCGCDELCDLRIRTNTSLGEIKDTVYGNADFNFSQCPIWIALNAPDMIELEDNT